MYSQVNSTVGSLPLESDVCSTLSLDGSTVEGPAVKQEGLEHLWTQDSIALAPEADSNAANATKTSIVEASPFCQADPGTGTATPSSKQPSKTRLEGPRFGILEQPNLDQEFVLVCVFDNIREAWQEEGELCAGITALRSARRIRRDLFADAEREGDQAKENILVKVDNNDDDGNWLAPPPPVDSLARKVGQLSISSHDDDDDDSDGDDSDVAVQAAPKRTPQMSAVDRNRREKRLEKTAAAAAADRQIQNVLRRRQPDLRSRGGIVSCNRYRSPNLPSGGGGGPSRPMAHTTTPNDLLLLLPAGGHGEVYEVVGHIGRYPVLSLTKKTAARLPKDSDEDGSSGSSGSSE
ncbi:hypothetical protein M426DRAFT_20078 [Hypoxylon sp. CI-4A]|nr:hypothetical protein M426DRAFT_20078 [Hypoxylon sp. CI-4A]